MRFPTGIPWRLRRALAEIRPWDPRHLNGRFLQRLKLLLEGAKRCTGTLPTCSLINWEHPPGFPVGTGNRHIPMDEMDPLLNLLDQRPREDWSWNFEPAAQGENAVNAVALCNASLLTYSPQQDVRRFLAKWGFEEPIILRGSATQGFVARRGDIVIVAFRGTEPVNADDWLSQRKLPSARGGQGPGAPS